MELPTSALQQMALQGGFNGFHFLSRCRLSLADRLRVDDRREGRPVRRRDHYLDLLTWISDNAGREGPK